MSVLADRLRAVVAPRGPGGAKVPPLLESSAVAPGVSRTVSHLESVLGGEWRREHAAEPCFVIEKRQDAATRHGRTGLGEIAARLEEASAELALLSGGAGARLPLLFFDLETTGLSGGAGTYAFLVGCGWFAADGAFLTRQCVLTRFADERPLLATVAAELARAGALVSFNGRSFDAPLLETRYLFHRLEWAGSRLPHIDMLHPARRFWRDDDLGRGATPCSLGALERQVLGAGRVGDVPGFEIPARYFRVHPVGRCEAARRRHRAQPSRSAVTRRVDGAAPPAASIGAGGDAVGARGRGARPHVCACGTRGAGGRRVTGTRWGQASRRRCGSMGCGCWRSRCGAGGASRRRRRAGGSCSTSRAARVRSCGRRTRRSRFTTSTASAI